MLAAHQHADGHNPICPPQGRTLIWGSLREPIQIGVRDWWGVPANYAAVGGGKMNQWFSSLPAFAKWTIGVVSSALIGMVVTFVVTKVASGRACFLSQAQVIHSEDYQGQKVFQLATYTKNYGRGSVKDVNVRYVYTVEEDGELAARLADVISENPPDSSSDRCRKQKRENWNGRNELTVEFVGCDFEPTEAMDTFTGPYLQKARKIVTTVENEGGARWVETMWLSDRDYLKAPFDQSLRGQDEFNGTTSGYLFWLKWVLAPMICLTNS